MSKVVVYSPKNVTEEQDKKNSKIYYTLQEIILKPAWMKLCRILKNKLNVILYDHAMLSPALHVTYGINC